MNILFSIDKHYIPQARVMLMSLLRYHPNQQIQAYLLHSSLTHNELDDLTSGFPKTHFHLNPIRIDDEQIKSFPVTSRYPTEIYYRIFAAHFLPESLERILYLDPDLIVRGDLTELYHLEMGEAFYAAASHVQKPLQVLNTIRLSMDEMGPYINSGVLLMNLSQLRRDQKMDEVFQYVDRKKTSLILPDQDIISGLYFNRIIEINTYIYNMTEKLLTQNRLTGGPIDLQWVEKNSLIIHYCGRNKPWKDNYNGRLDRYYHQMFGYAEATLSQTKKGAGTKGPDAP